MNNLSRYIRSRVFPLKSSKEFTFVVRSGKAQNTGRQAIGGNFYYSLMSVVLSAGAKLSSGIPASYSATFRC